MAEWRAEIDAQADKREAFRDVVFSKEFNEFNPNLIPIGEGSKHKSACWGIVIEDRGVFLRGGCYTISALCEHPAGKSRTHSCKMDFIAMSRCVLPEGSELWLKIDKGMYQSVLEQAKSSGHSLRLPISDALHNNMPEHHSCYLRCFYVLGGSLHDKPAEANFVTVVCVIASKRSVPGKKAAVDDFAAAASCVNQNIAAENTRLLSISLPIHREDGSPALDYSRDPALPFYKYLKMR